MDRIIEVKNGDKIQALGITAEIGEILYQHIDLGDRHIKPFADIEFRDSAGNYRHYQSFRDGGEIQTEFGIFKFEIEG